MDIREALAAEHSKRQTMTIVDYIGDDAKRFAELMSVFFEGEYRLTQRAAWPMSYVAIRQPQLIQQYLRRLVDQLERKDVHNAVRRNVVRLLEDIEIPNNLKGRVYTICIDLLDDVREPVAVRAFAMTVAAKIAKVEPDLLSELRLVIKTHLPNFSAALRARARNIL
ncbi:MAG TPA: hypothetical protein VGQ55_05480 [Pyrinomonadaceae bacterium]|nr:hypothetical protein [Pyrinomonadaceae bacterium]